MIDFFSNCLVIFNDKLSHFCVQYPSYLIDVNRFYKLIVPSSMAYVAYERRCLSGKIHGQRRGYGIFYLTRQVFYIRILFDKSTHNNFKQGGHHD